MFSKPKTNVCPFLKDECIGASCAMWTTVMGKNPQTGQDVNMPDCAIKWLPTLLIESSKVGRETGAAVESFRNEVTSANREINKAIAANVYGTLPRG
jgi:hypothetical protein